MERHRRQCGWGGRPAAQCRAANHQHGAARPQSSQRLRWSVGNEIGTSVDESRDGMSFGRLAATREMVLKQDATRPVGIACHTPGTVAQAVYDPLDFTGWN